MQDLVVAQHLRLGHRAVFENKQHSRYFRMLRAGLLRLGGKREEMMAALLVPYSLEQSNKGRTVLGLTHSKYPED